MDSSWLPWVHHGMPRDPTAAYHGFPRDFLWDPVGFRGVARDENDIMSVPACSHGVPRGPMCSVVFPAGIHGILRDCSLGSFPDISHGIPQLSLIHI